MANGVDGRWRGSHPPLRSTARSPVRSPLLPRSPSAPTLQLSLTHSLTHSLSLTSHPHPPSSSLSLTLTLPLPHSTFRFVESVAQCGRLRRRITRRHLDHSWYSQLVLSTPRHIDTSTRPPSLTDNSTDHLVKHLNHLNHLNNHLKSARRRCPSLDIGAPRLNDATRHPIPRIPSYASHPPFTYHPPSTRPHLCLDTRRRTPPKHSDHQFSFSPSPPLDNVSPSFPLRRFSRETSAVGYVNPTRD
ncbi:hypothetical protein BJ875DRAFT_216277 [Amylocarpus encephaloides]|uniref:Uncharacterized protein n=1 Tax=Amylocarpus encephaloides TaxID=45428 RepID=A0A9P7Y9K5_9HELO|nr:hypothetical protein BJ875DRAFT_216277 [Amylocarpus encephaloides]